MKSKELEGDFELNIASIIDCFTVLITYLLLSASFISLGMFDVNVAISSDTPTPPAAKTSNLSLTVEVMKNNDLKVDFDGAPNSNSQTQSNHLILQNLQGKQDLDQLERFLKSTQSSNPSLDAAMISAEDSVQYKQLINIIERVKLILPQVALSADLDSPAIASQTQ